MLHFLSTRYLKRLLLASALSSCTKVSAFICVVLFNRLFRLAVSVTRIYSQLDQNCSTICSGAKKHRTRTYVTTDGIKKIIYCFVPWMQQQQQQLQFEVNEQSYEQNRTQELSYCKQNKKNERYIFEASPHTQKQGFKFEICLPILGNELSNIFVCCSHPYAWVQQNRMPGIITLMDLNGESIYPNN